MKYHFTTVYGTSVSLQLVPITSKVFLWNVLTEMSFVLQMTRANCRLENTLYLHCVYWYYVNWMYRTSLWLLFSNIYLCDLVTCFLYAVNLILLRCSNLWHSCTCLVSVLPIRKVLQPSGLEMFYLKSLIKSLYKCFQSEYLFQLLIKWLNCSIYVCF